MVLKRLIVTALGALGLGALATGPAFGQQSPGDGNIPAPNLFDDQIACTMNLPNMAMRATTTVVPDMGMTSPLDDAIGMGDVELNSSNANIGTVLDDIGYVIPASVANCGNALGTPADAEAGWFGGAQDASIPMDVAEGYSLLLDEFVDVYGDPNDAMSTGAAGALDDARKALAMADSTTTETQLENLQEAVDDALAEYNKQKAEFDALAGGPIYEAGVAEWMAKSAVTNAIVSYNTSVTMANMARTTLTGTNYESVTIADDGTQTRASKYVPLTGTELTGLVTFANGMATIATGTTTANLEDYANANGNQFATVNAMSGATEYTGTSNFDRNGNLVVPMEDADSNDETPATPVYETSSFTVGDIQTRVEQYNQAAAAFKKLRDENQNVLLQALYDVVYDRAQAEADYYNSVWADVISDSTDLRTQTDRAATGDAAVDPFSIASRYSASVRANNARQTAEDDLRAKAVAREAATEGVVSAFQTPASFYDQLVARRQAKKFAADKAVADAENPSSTLTKAAEDAAKALMDAEEAQSDFQGLFADASTPVQDLVTELLKTDGDDGQKLVDAISGSYDAADAAKTTADEAKTTADQVAEDVKDLTGDEGAVNVNTRNIEANTKSIDGIEAEIWGDASTDGMSRIDANETRSMTNATNIATNATNIATNAENIMGLRTDVDSNTGRIMQNETDIMTNAGNIMTNSGRLDAAEAAIVEGAGLIAGNTASIGENRSSIMRNADMIGGLQDQMEIVRAGVAASMALAGMPAINGRGISIGVGSFDGESAFAVGFQIQSDMASFKVGVTSAGGETGASAGVGFQF